MDHGSFLHAAGGRALQQAAAGPLEVTVGGELDLQLTQLWILICGYLVFFMQCGFALLEAGTVRAKNTKNILLKNVIDASISTIAWWALGNGFAYGACGQNGFIGAANFFSSQSKNHSGKYWSEWFFSWAFAGTASTIVSGAVAERMQFKAYVLYTMWVSAFVYPVVVHWVWSNSGWLSAKRQTECGQIGYTPIFSGTNGLMDFAGSGVVHMVGGGAALVGAIFVGPRLGRFTEEGKVNEADFQPSSATNQALGVFILWLGWYGFNSGSTSCFLNCMPVAAQVAVNTTLATGAGALTCLFLAVMLGAPGDIGPLLNGILAGAVSITAPCAVVQSYGAVIIGVVGGLVYTGSAKMLQRLHIDDPLDAAPVHFFCGAWGVISVGFFATETSVAAAYGYASGWGCFYGDNGKQLGVQLLGVVCIAAWTCALNGGLFYLLRRLAWLRVPAEVEKQGLDIAQGLGSGVLGGIFKKNPYTTAMNKHLTREGARDKAADYAV